MRSCEQNRYKLINFDVNSYVYEFHFTLDHWENRDARQLKKGAVPTLFCFCSKKRSVKSSLLPSARVSLPVIIKPVLQFDHIYCNENKKLKYENQKKRGKLSKESGIDREDSCPMKTRIIEHNYTMLLPVHNNTTQIPSTLKNAHNIYVPTEGIVNDLSIKESSNSLSVEESLFPHTSDLTDSLSNTLSMNFNF